MTDFELSAQHADPCSSYHSPVCGSVSTTETDYANYFTNPQTLRDGNGCFMFNGCYLKNSGHYYYWQSQQIGYIEVHPVFVGAQSYAPGAGLAANQPLPSPASGPAPCPEGQVWAQNLGRCIPVSAWSSNPSNPFYVPASQIPIANGGTMQPGQASGGQSSIDLAPLQGVLAGLQGTLSGLPALNAVTAGLPAALLQALVSANSPLIDAITRLINQLNANSQAPQVNTQLVSSTISQVVGQLGEQLTKSNADLAQQITEQVVKDVGLGNTQTAPAATLFDQISQALQSAQHGGILDPEKLIKEPITQAAGELGHEIEGRFEAYRLIFEHLMQGQFKDWAEFQQALNTVGQNFDWVYLIITAIGALTVILRLGVIRVEPVAEELAQLSWADNPTRQLDQNVLIEGLRRKELTFDEFAAALGKHGLDSDKATLLFELSENLPDMSFLEVAVNRGVIMPSDAIKILSKQGFSDETIQAIVSLWSHIPAPTDITRIADKRIWSNQTDPKYGQYAELPDEYTKFMGQWGIDPEFVKWLWAAHWNLPSPQQIFEMFHRGVIDQVDMETYLGLTDWLPYFRDKLLAISYNPLGRIDIKRAHNSGFIDDNTALQKYKDIGFNDENARILLQISKQSGHDNAEHLLQSLTDRARTQVERAYVKGTINASEAASHLTALGIDASTAQALIDILNHEIAVAGAVNHTEAHQKRAIDLVLRDYAKATLPEADALSLLGSLGMSATDAKHELQFADIERAATLKSSWAGHAQKLYADHTIDYPGFTQLLETQGFNANEIAQLGLEADIMRQQRTKKPTEAEFTKMFKAQIIDQTQYEAELRGLGFAESYIPLIVALNGG